MNDVRDETTVPGRQSPPGGAVAEKVLKHPGVPYRPDIDGLRAIATLTVIFFHAGIVTVSGGYVGVDVFFVISGFLITKIIIADIHADRFTYAGFYRRRIKRIVPAFAVVTLASAAVGLVISVPSQLEDLGKSLVAAAVAMTNVLFWDQTGYFAPAAETKPLLHTWSLSVEEQFYIIFPIILLLARRVGARGPLAVTAAIFLLSLLASQLLVRSAPAFSFFLLPTRAWELMAGSILALEPRLLFKRRHSAWLVAAGIALILAASFLYTSDTPFPGFAALVPVLGSALVIAAGGHGDSISARVLGNPVMVWVGRASYSLYLWHWPLFAYWRYWHSRHPTPTEAFVLIAITFGLSALSYRYVEQPCRTRIAFKGRKPFIFTAVVTLVIGSIGLLYYRTGGLPQRFDSDIRQLVDVARYQPDRRSECMSGPHAWREASLPCVYGADVEPTVALWGDSHAFAVVDALGDELAAQNQSAVFLGYAGCPPVIGLRINRLDNRCAEFATGALEYLVAQPSIRSVVLLARHARHLEGNTEEFGPAEAGSDDILPEPVTLRGTRLDPLPAAYEDRLRRTVTLLRKAGKQVIVVMPIPEVPYDVPNMIALRKLRGEDPDFAVPRSMYETRQRDVIPMLERIAGQEGASLVGITDLICGPQTCTVMRDGNLLYYDDDHLTRYGAALLAKRLADRIEGEKP